MFWKAYAFFFFFLNAFIIAVNWADYKFILITEEA